MITDEANIDFGQIKRVGLVGHSRAQVNGPRATRAFMGAGFRILREKRKLQRA